MQTLPNKIRIVFLFTMLVLMAGMLIREILIPQQFNSQSDVLIAKACQSIKGCGTTEIVSVRGRYWPAPVLKIHMAAKSKTNLDEMRPIFDRAMSDRYEKLNHFQKWTQGKYDYEVKYDK